MVCIFHISENQEKMYLYLIVSITSGLLVFMIIVIARLMVHKYRAVREVKMYSSHHDHTIPHGELFFSALIIVD